MKLMDSNECNNIHYYSRNNKKYDCSSNVSFLRFDEPLSVSGQTVIFWAGNSFKQPLSFHPQNRFFSKPSFISWLN